MTPTDDIPTPDDVRRWAAEHPDALWAPPSYVYRLLDRLARAEAAVVTARFVATYWRDSGMDLHREGSPFGAMVSHPCAMVLAALDGETEPRELGISPDRWDDFRLAVRGGS